MCCVCAPDASCLIRHRRHKRCCSSGRDGRRHRSIGAGGSQSSNGNLQGSGADRFSVSVLATMARAELLIVYGLSLIHI